MRGRSSLECVHLDQLLAVQEGVEERSAPVNSHRLHEEQVDFVAASKLNSAVNQIIPEGPPRWHLR